MACQFRDPARLALCASVGIVVLILVRRALMERFPAYAWIIDLVFFVPLPLLVFAFVAKATGWRGSRLAGFELMKSGSMFDPPRWVVIAVAATCLALVDIVLTVLLLKPIMGLQQMAGPAMAAPQDMIASAPGAAKWVALAYMCLSAGIVEEIAYRGMTAHFFLDRARPLAASYVLATSALFAVGHAGRGPGVMLMAFVTGLLFGAWFARTRDLGTLVAAHVLIDLFWFRGAAA